MGDHEAIFQRALGAMNARDLAGAERHFRDVVKLQPDHVPSLNLLTVVLMQMRRFGDAEPYIRRAVQIAPSSDVSFYNYGLILKELHRPDEALEQFDRALGLNPNVAETWNNRGSVHNDLKQYAKAIADFDKAISLAPGFAEALCNKARSLHELKRHKESLECYARAQTLKPDLGEAHYNEALCRLLLGDFKRGWRQFEHRWNTERFRKVRRNFAQPLWIGDSSIAGKTILLYAEQGFGDTILMSRYVPMVAALGAKVVLEVQPQLLGLAKSLAAPTAVVATGTALPPFDLHCPLMSLPLAFRTTLDTIPRDIPYLRPSEDKIEAWRARVRGPGIKAGIAWAGNASFPRDRERSIALPHLAPLLCTPNATFFSLQKELRPGDRELMNAHPSLVDLAPEIADFEDTAAIMISLDLVISIDSAVANLGGALGRPTWVLLPYTPEWRWLEERRDTPWYPTARLFRQTIEGDWRTVTDAVIKELAAF